MDIESKDKVIKMIKVALAEGGTTYMEPQDLEWMFAHSFADLDGHQCEIMCIDEKAMPK